MLKIYSENTNDKATKRCIHIIEQLKTKHEKYINILLVLFNFSWCNGPAYLLISITLESIKTTYLTNNF